MKSTSGNTRTLELTCITCPIGCKLKVLLEGSRIISIEGNKCPKGIIYVQNEIDPKRILITVIKVVGGNLPVVSVKTSEPIPKNLRLDAMKILSKVVIKAPIKVGDIVVKNLLELGANVIATRDVVAV